MNRKAAIELTTNFFIGIVIGIVLFSLALVFFGRILSGADTIRKYGLPDIFDQYAEQCVNRGDKVCVPIVKKDVELGDSESFGIVVNNLAGQEKMFKMLVEFSIGQLKDGTEVTSLENSWTFDDFEPISIQNNEHKVFEVPILVPRGARSGTYVFNVNICYQSDTDAESSKCPSEYPSLYGLTHKITVTVP